VLGDLRPAPRGADQGRGQLHAGRRRHPRRSTAVEIGTGKAATSVTIEASSGLSNDEIKRLAAGMR
jgi:hypothetical protein